MAMSLMRRQDIIHCKSFREIVAILRAQASWEKWPVCVFPIGAQGAGKTTLGIWLERELGDVNRICPDEIRMDLYRRTHPEIFADYRDLEKFLTSGRQKEVRHVALQRFWNNRASFLYIDQMNLTPEARLFYLSEDNVNIAIVFQVPLERMLKRHRKRPDKAEVISDGAVRSSYCSRQIPRPGEFDLVILYEEEPNARAESVEE